MTGVQFLWFSECPWQVFWSETRVKMAHECQDRLNKEVVRSVWLGDNQSRIESHVRMRSSSYPALWVGGVQGRVRPNEHRRAKKSVARSFSTVYVQVWEEEKVAVGRRHSWGGPRVWRAKCTTTAGMKSAFFVADWRFHSMMSSAVIAEVARTLPR